MSQHLSQQQMDEWLIGDRPAEVAAHLQSCQGCAETVARADETLSQFRTAVRSWSAEQMSGTRPLPAASSSHAWWWSMPLAFAMLLLALVLPIVKHRPVPVNSSSQDDVLLQKVQSEISQSVPTPMEPIAKLMPTDFSR